MVQEIWMRFHYIFLSTTQHNWKLKLSRVGYLVYILIQRE